MKLFAICTLVAVLMSGCAKTANKTGEGYGKTGGVIEGRAKLLSKSDQAAVDAIKKLGGTVKMYNRYDGKDKFDDDGDRTIGRQETVSEVTLSGPNVTDAALVHLRGMEYLRKLSLSQSGVSDAGLVHLHGLTRLHVLDLRATNVTDDGVNKLRAALPKCTIDLGN